MRIGQTMVMEMVEPCCLKKSQKSDNLQVTQVTEATLVIDKDNTGRHEGEKTNCSQRQMKGLPQQ